ncbi:patatin-like phospholipase family protein [Polaribacter pectinis]|uniref:Patatin-like phospholipase family protein n=1 Tax=Polaribacter pectinis TaxID=2738844 RepID=A0A7G9L9X0_9FLAO|nr:patatin-like phospholipase family protein [Polaribacter pectinis]QNM85419.1 patatin-like phospholipase family protein [Polaribacter pectinis]
MKKYIFLLFILISFSVFSQKKQPKIGLVLSGGGAKGFAHIGVLKEIDKAGIQLDYIGGTSMGAIIGGLYAAGYSANQIEEIVLKTDFLTLIRDRLPRSSETFFEKEYGEKTVITLPVNKGRVGLPRGISKGQNVLNLLLELFDSVDGNQDFSKLSIPFFCIATDVENGSPVILEKGSLPIALRASGSFPSLLNPVDVGDKLLVDGGIANNFPVSVMKNKGIDIVIGVDVEGKLFQKDKINSVVALLNQIMSYQMYSKTDEEIKKLDVYIHPEIQSYTVVDFDKKNEILEKGNIEAKKYTKVFEEIAAKQIVKRKRKTLKFSTKKLLISSIGIDGAENYTRAYVLGKLNIKEGDSLSRNDITKKIYLLSATRNYNRIEYNLIKKIDKSYLLDFKVKESDENANLQIGVHYDLLYKSSVLATYNQKHLLKDNDLFSLDMILGDNLRYNLSYFVDNGFYVSYGFRSRYNHFRSNSKFNQVSNLPNVSKVNLSYSDITNQTFFQTTFNRKFALGLGLEHKWVRAATETLASTVNPDGIIDKSHYYNVFGYLKLDTYNKRYFATKGYFADLNFKWYMASSDYNKDFKMFSQGKGTIGFATSFGDRFTFQNTNEAGFTFGKPTSNIFDFYLGDYNQNYINTFVSLYGYEFTAMSNNSFVKSQFDFRYRVGERHYFSVIANYARLEENVFKNIDLFDNIKSGYALGYSYDSFLGPVELKYSWSPDTKKRYWLFNLGFWF